METNLNRIDLIGTLMAKPEVINFSPITTSFKILVQESWITKGELVNNKEVFNCICRDMDSKYLEEGNLVFVSGAFRKGYVKVKRCISLKENKSESLLRNETN